MIEKDYSRGTLCKECRHGKDRFRESCYCVKYGIMIGYGKRECEGYDKQVQEQKDCNEGRDV
jgi:hypothetical protein